MRTALRILACAALVAAASTATARVTEDKTCKNHYILSQPVGCWWKRMPSMHMPRSGHTATLLRDGTVLIVGGIPTSDVDQDGNLKPPSPHTVERFDPASGTWRFAAPMNRGRSWHAATLLEDGRVLVVGGENAFHYRTLGGRAEIYDPVEDRWTYASHGYSLTRWLPAAALLPDGRVLVTGGTNIEGFMGFAEIYDPLTDAWTPTGEMRTPRYGHTATALDDGRILFSGGVDDDFLGTSVAQAELYDPASHEVVSVALASVPRASHRATRLADGNVMVSGGWVSTMPPGRSGYMSFLTTGTTEIHDVASGTWRPGPDLKQPRYSHTVSTLRDGTLLIVGGMRSFSNVPTVSYATLNSTEMLTPSGDHFHAAELIEARHLHTATVLANGSILVVGGRTASGASIASVELFEVPTGK